MYSLIKNSYLRFGIALPLGIALVFMGFLSSFRLASAHQDPLNCNASGLQQFPSISPLGNVHDGDVITYSVIYVNSDPDGGGPVAPCNVTGANASIDLPGAGPVLNVLTNATLNIGASITCPGGPGCAPGPYTYAVNHADEASSSVTAIFDIAGVLHQDANEEAASDHDTLSKTVIHPTTIVGISALPTLLGPGGTTTLTVTEQNDGDVDLTGAHVDVDHGVGTLSAPPTSGDDGDGVLEPGETWSWTVLNVAVGSTTTYTATGHGTDPLGTDITYPGDPQERATTTVTVSNPSTIVDLSASSTLITAGGTTTLTIKEQNDGDVNLTGAHVVVDHGIGTLSAPPTSGDDGDGILEPGETWVWTVQVSPATTTTYTATGHGTDPQGNDITYPADPQERDSVTIEVQQKVLAQGCSPGYWKQPQHYGSYPSGVYPNSLFTSVGFENAFPGKSLLEVLSTGGGGLTALGRIITGAYLNAATVSGFPYTSAQVVADFNAVYPGGNYDVLKSKYEALQDPCPFGRNPGPAGPNQATSTDNGLGKGKNKNN